jgi:predicted TIM-barrel fold metal-dependent hydrolase
MAQDTTQLVVDPPAAEAAPEKLYIVDADSHNFPTLDDIAAYMPQRWRDYLKTFGLRTPGELGVVRARWMACRTDSWSPTGKPPGADPDFFREQLLDRYDIDVTILNNIMASAQPFVGGAAPQEFTDALMAAGNDWALEHWLDDPRMYTSLLLPYEEPRSALRELERLGKNDRFLQILLPFRTQRPIGNRKYWDLLEAAVEYDLPLAFHPGNGANAPLTGVGWPSFYFEEHSALPHSLMNQMASLICEGVFDRWPDLKIVFQEGGWSWVEPYAWRLDRSWRQLREEVSHLERKPSDYIHDRFWYTTQPLEEPERPEQFGEALEMFGRPERLMFSSDYPHWDFDAPDSVLASIPEEMHAAVMGGNALDLYQRLPRPSGM